MSERLCTLIPKSYVHSISGARVPRLMKSAQTLFGDGELQPSAISLCVAGNDCMTTCPMETVLRNYGKLIDYIHEKVPGAVIYLCYIPPTRPTDSTNNRIRTLNAWLYQQSQEREYVLAVKTSSLDRSHFQPDYIHLKPVGRNYFVDNLAAAIQNFHRPQCLVI